MTATRLFQARFAAVCPACHENIQPGQWVAYDEDKNLVHLACAEDGE